MAYTDALRYALMIIENYEADMRNSESYAPLKGVNLAEIGFCQGIAYKDARKTILEIYEREAANGNH